MLVLHSQQWVVNKWFGWCYYQGFNYHQMLVDTGLTFCLSVASSVFCGLCLKIPGPIFSPFSALPTDLWASVLSQLFYPLSCLWQEGESSGYTWPQWCHMSILDQSLYQWKCEALIGSGMGHISTSESVGESKLKTMSWSWRECGFPRRNHG